MATEKRAQRIAALAWGTALGLDFARVAVWRTITGRVSSPGLLLFTKALLFTPWLLYTWLLIRLTRRRRWLVTPSARFFAVHGLLALGMTVAHTLLLGAGFLMIDMPGARQAGLPGLLVDVWLNFAALDGLAALAATASVTAWRQYELYRATAELQTPGDAPVDSFSVSRRNRLEVVPATSVDWIEASGNYIELHCGGASHLTRANIGQLETRLDPRRFLRIHRSTIVNLGRARALERGPVGWRLRLADGRQLPVSRRRLRAVQSALAS